MIGLGWIMLYNTVIEKCIDNNNHHKKRELEKNNINFNNIIVVNKI